MANAPDRAQAELAQGVKQLGPGRERNHKAMNRAIQIWPEYTEAYLNRGVAEHNTSHEPALADLDRALELEPRATRPYEERGQIYLENGDTSRAIRNSGNPSEWRPPSTAIISGRRV